ncbi:hypothetical protein KUL42_25710 [Alteromonas sp. KUL42]|uniref:hypothetical protein n=1 Tax=Alteromonas sp. KUL42 TaxID=2480797 RepID=UPI00103692B9|nr:hypothetical protein [Alteromonas sp. KUL42]TAP34407.1 hypothetical protein EYR97_12690 [Alteromonas sp. KUL42]GEA07810.1 hypothetical protein KUL42_25710 [Alteromonas sp. KUL42]
MSILFNQLDSAADSLVAEIQYKIELSNDELEIHVLEANREQIESFAQIIVFFNIFFVFVALSVAANYITIATTENTDKKIVHDVSEELKKQLYKIEDNQKLIILLLTVLICIGLVIIFTS